MDDFEDLFDEGTLLEDSSQESLTYAAANLAFCESDGEDTVHACQPSPPPGIGSEHIKHSANEVVSAIDLTSGLDERPHGAVDAGVDLFPPMSPTSRTTTAEHPTAGASVIDEIEGVFDQIADALLSKKDKISVTLKMRSTSTITSGKYLADKSFKPQAEVKTRCICYPGKSPEEAWRFGTLMWTTQLCGLGADPLTSSGDSYHGTNA